jgi:hypothetical protein
LISNPSGVERPARETERQRQREGERETEGERQREGESEINEQLTIKLLIKSTM